MPLFHDLAWVTRSIRQMGFVGLISKRPRRAVPYVNEILARYPVKCGSIKRRKRGR